MAMMLPVSGGHARIPATPQLGQSPELSDHAVSTEEWSSGAAVLAAASFCSAGLQIAWRRRRRTGNGATAVPREASKFGRRREPPPPTWLSLPKVIDVTVNRPEQKGYTEPPPPPPSAALMRLEAALRSDSLRALLIALSKAGGNLPKDPLDPVRKPEPVMNASLTARSLLMFAGLRHGASDDMSPMDLQRGELGDGLRVLMKRSKKNLRELAESMDGRIDDIVRIVRAFYDLPQVIKQNGQLFQNIIEPSLPMIARRSAEPFPRLLNFLDAYESLQLEFLYAAVRENILSSRPKDFDVGQLQELARAWASRAKSGSLAIIQVTKVKTVVEVVATLPTSASAQQYTTGAAEALWAAVDEVSPAIERLQKQLEEGVLERGIPSEIMAVIASSIEVQATRTGSFLAFVTAKLLQAMQGASEEEAVAVLGFSQPSSTVKYPKCVLQTLQECSAGFAASASEDALQRLLTKWKLERYSLQECIAAFTTEFVKRAVGGSLSAECSTRAAALLLELSNNTASLQPVVCELLGEQQVELIPEDEWIDALRTLALLWPSKGAAAVSLQEVELVTRLLGPEESNRAADKAVESLLDTLAAQLPRSNGLLAGLVEWRTTQARRLGSIVAPCILEAVSLPASKDALEGELSLAVSLLSGAAEGKSMGLRDAEKALRPFSHADSQDMDKAVKLVASACKIGPWSLPASVMTEAALHWLAEDSPAGLLGAFIVSAVVSEWEEEGATSLENMSETCKWLEEQVAGLGPAMGAAGEHLYKVVASLTTLEDILRGQGCEVQRIQEVRSLILKDMGKVGYAALADTVAMTWSRDIPGFPARMAGTCFELWWNGHISNEELVQQVARQTLEELRWTLESKVEATWGGRLPLGGQTPAFRVEGVAGTVTWFVAEETVAEASRAYALQKAELTGGAVPERDADGKLVVHRMSKPRRQNRVAGSASVMGKALEATGGRCMYCGSNYELEVALIWPESLGGTVAVSNVAACCSHCSRFKELLGAEKWGQALAASPEAAAQVWWAAQKKADVTMTADLSNSAKEA